VVEVEVAHRNDVDAPRVEAGLAERRDDRRTLVAAHRANLLGDALADAGLDEDAARRRLDEEAVERLQQPVLVVDLVRYEAAPEDPRHWPEQCPGVGPERAGLDQGDAGPPAEIGSPVDGVVDGHAIRQAGGPSAR
jgi:hypothetical protein